MDGAPVTSGVGEARNRGMQAVAQLLVVPHDVGLGPGRDERLIARGPPSSFDRFRRV
jgi:hypothetical protein